MGIRIPQGKKERKTRVKPILAGEVGPCRVYEKQEDDNRFQRALATKKVILAVLPVWADKKEARDKTRIFLYACKKAFLEAKPLDSWGREYSLSPIGVSTGSMSAESYRDYFSLCIDKLIELLSPQWDKATKTLIKGGVQCTIRAVYPARVQQQGTGATTGKRVNPVAQFIRERNQEKELRWLSDRKSERSELEYIVAQVPLHLGKWTAMRKLVRLFAEVSREERRSIVIASLEARENARKLEREITLAELPDRVKKPIPQGRIEERSAFEPTYEPTRPGDMADTYESETYGEITEKSPIAFKRFNPATLAILVSYMPNMAGEGEGI